jgi:hypothetical protein
MALALVGDLDVSVSGNSGRYTIHGSRQLSLGDLDLSYRSSFADGACRRHHRVAETTPAMLRKYGLYALAALRPIGVPRAVSAVRLDSRHPA